MKQLLFVALLAAVYQHSEGQDEAAFCDAVRSVPVQVPDKAELCSARTCRVHYCNAAGAVLICPLSTPQFTFVNKLTIRLCTDPPRLDMAIIGVAKVRVDESVTESKLLPTSEGHTNVTFNVLDNVIEFGVEVIASQGTDPGAWIGPTTLPFNRSICPANVSGTVFDCPDLLGTGTLHSLEDRADTVHRLKPTDIKVVGAIGNSLTAGFSTLGQFVDYKGVSFSGGGYATVDLVTTIPNILKEYRPNLVGFSAELSDSEEESLNVAVTGANSINITTQTRLLIDRIRSNPNIDLDKDWKLVTVAMGYNDICDYSCFDNALDLVQGWVDNIDGALTTMSKSLPRTFVNLILLGTPSVVLRYIAASPNREFCEDFFRSHCPCILQTATMSDIVAKRFNEALTELVESGKFDSTNGFTVVLQPSTPLLHENVTVDLSYATQECMHLSGAGQRLSAVFLWNNMLRPVGSKETGPTTDSLPKCPSEDFPYFYTYLNSEGCPPLCTHEYCSSRETGRADCTLPGTVSKCGGRCLVTSCRACYYSKWELKVPDTNLSCQTFPGTRCFRNWPPSSLRSQEHFKCFQAPCPEN